MTGSWESANPIWCLAVWRPDYVSSVSMLRELWEYGEKAEKLKAIWSLHTKWQLTRLEAEANTEVP